MGGLFNKSRNVVFPFAVTIGPYSISKYVLMIYKTYKLTYSFGDVVIYFFEDTF